MGYLSARRTLVGPPTQAQEEEMIPQMAVPQTQVSAPEKASMDYGSVAQAGMSGAAMGGPMGAAIGAGGSFLTQYIAQRAADERAKRQAIGQAYQNQASNEQNIINTIMANNARALS